ncbi:hypothetical protein N7452_007203 [Penicillium brevicompactum]|uniref:Uncharacterized protein n=1 Tax=Penicillium brevicompactum TaxID=5074 RepID=A0A9W9QKC2_PENBR|nr:hypothetical protein N7452_007203 [Penicillium brevicompactum]
MHTAPAKTQAQQALSPAILAPVGFPLLSTPPHECAVISLMENEKGAGQRPNSRQDDNWGGRDARRVLASVDRYQDEGDQQIKGAMSLAITETLHHRMTLSSHTCAKPLGIVSVFGGVVPSSDCPEGTGKKRNADRDDLRALTFETRR